MLEDLIEPGTSQGTRTLNPWQNPEPMMTTHLKRDNERKMGGGEDLVDPQKVPMPQELRELKKQEKNTHNPNLSSLFDISKLRRIELIMSTACNLKL